MCPRVYRVPARLGFLRLAARVAQRPGNIDRARYVVQALRAEMGDRQTLQTAKALSDGTRLRLLHEITAGGEVSCGELARRFPLAQATVSHHLKVLEEAGLVAVRRDGQFHYFSAVSGALLAFSRNLAATMKRPAAAGGGPVR
jgi:ArsR family transcriptional regulator, arsenate/arsenite/antimonite-responsive transcriptional repressor